MCFRPFARRMKCFEIGPPLSFASLCKERGSMKKLRLKQARFVALALGLSYFGSPAEAIAAVRALFDLSTPSSGPFPSDWFTVVDPSYNTRHRVNLPLPDCAVRQSDCEDFDVINTLDGFNMQPRLSIPFDDTIDVTTVTSRTVFLVKLSKPDDDYDCDDVGRGEGACEAGSLVVGINQVVWNTFTNTLHVESNELLEQHASYGLIATRGIHDALGREVEASDAFRRFRQTVRGDYKHALLEAVRAARRLGVRERDIVTASVFTTQSATAILEKIRDQIKAATPDPADFNLRPDGTRTVFVLDQLTGITFNQQMTVDPPLTPIAFGLDALRVIPVVVERIAFGKYRSPDYEIHPGEFIPPVGTRVGVPDVQRLNEIFFNLFLPSSPKPAGGWPVAIFGHGGSGSKNGAPFLVAASMAARGVATIAINHVGHGFGPLGTLTVNQTTGGPVTFSAGGRGFDQNGDGVIGDREGSSATRPRMIIDDRDGFRQTIVDLMQLVRVIEVGVDVD